MYAVDSSAPPDTPYTGPILLDTPGAHVVTAVAQAATGEWSAPARASYVVHVALLPPVVSPANGTAPTAGAVDVKITPRPADATVWVLLLPGWDRGAAAPAMESLEPLPGAHPHHGVAHVRVDARAMLVLWEWHPHAAYPLAPQLHYVGVAQPAAAAVDTGNGATGTAIVGGVLAASITLIAAAIAAWRRWRAAEYARVSEVVRGMGWDQDELEVQ